MAEEERSPLPEAPRTGERTGVWWRVLVIGGVLFFLGVGILALTGNPNLFPTVIMLGSFLVPAAFVAFLYERKHLSRLTWVTVGLTFFYGGVLGVFAASLLEPMLIAQLNAVTAFVVGLIEEAAKILGVLVIARHRRHDSELDGLILGAAAGMGFAALESTGYAFTAFMRSGGSLSLTTGVILVRAVLSPLGHGTWTAILAGVLFREGRTCRFRVDPTVIGAYLFVSGLHGLWNAAPSLLAGLPASGITIPIAQVVVGATGLAILVHMWREALRRQEERAVEEERAGEE